jgi:hypothetical protein
MLLGIVAWDLFINIGVAFMLIGVPILIAGAGWGLARGR